MWDLGRRFNHSYAIQSVAFDHLLHFHLFICSFSYFLNKYMLLSWIPDTAASVRPALASKINIIPNLSILLHSACEQKILIGFV